MPHTRHLGRSIARRAALLVGTVGLLLGALAVPPATAAVTYVLNSTADDSDGSCDVLPGGDCTFREAIAERAAALVLVHNHPSGDPTPSAEDRAVTDQLVAAGRLLDIPVHDHVIVGRGRYASFAEAGLL